MVTNPIQKSALYAAGFRHPGHTEYLAHLAGLADEPIMMLAAADLELPTQESKFRSSGKQGRHSEHMGYILAEMQYLQRSYPGGVW